MSKYYIRIGIEEGKYTNPKLIKKSLFNKKIYDLPYSNKLLKAINNNEIDIKIISNGKAAFIKDINTITEYSAKSKNIIKNNKIKKVLATTAFITTIGIFSLIGKKESHADVEEYTKYEHIINDKNINKDINSNNSNINKDINNNNNNSKTVDLPYEPVVLKQNLENKAINDNNQCVYSFDYSDRSNDFVDEINEKYGDSINFYSDAYGMDANLIKAIICQENPTNIKNYSNIGGYGLMQIESVNNGSEISVYNFNTNEMEKIVIDTIKCREDDDYGIKVGTMMLSYCYNYVKSQNTENRFSDEDTVLLTLFAYNKGIGTIRNSMGECNNLEECIDYIKNKNYGDDDYIEHVLSRIKDGTTISLKDKTGNETSLIIDNKNVDVFKKSNL